MNGAHDMGGMHGFGAVRDEPEGGGARRRRRRRGAPAHEKPYRRPKKT